jgi:hypothetical protein
MLCLQGRAARGVSGWTLGHGTPPYSWDINSIQVERVRTDPASPSPTQFQNSEMNRNRELSAM